MWLCLKWYLYNLRIWFLSRQLCNYLYIWIVFCYLIFLGFFPSPCLFFGGGDFSCIDWVILFHFFLHNYLKVIILSSSFSDHLVMLIFCIIPSNKPILLFHINYQNRFVDSCTFFKVQQRRLFTSFKFCNLTLRSKGLSHAIKRKADRKTDSPPAFFIACQLLPNPDPRNLSNIEAGILVWFLLYLLCLEKCVCIS